MICRRKGGEEWRGEGGGVGWRHYFGLYFNNTFHKPTITLLIILPFIKKMFFCCFVNKFKIYFIENILFLFFFQHYLHKSTMLSSRFAFAHVSFLSNFLFYFSNYYYYFFKIHNFLLIRYKNSMIRWINDHELYWIDWSFENEKKKISILIVKIFISAVNRSKKFDQKLDSIIFLLEIFLMISSSFQSINIYHVLKKIDLIARNYVQLYFAIRV